MDGHVRKPDGTATSAWSSDVVRGKTDPAIGTAELCDSVGCSIARETPWWAARLPVRYGRVGREGQPRRANPGRWPREGVLDIAWTHGIRGPP